MPPAKPRSQITTTQGWGDSGPTPLLESRTFERTLSVPSWGKTQMRHWKHATPEQLKSMNVSLADKEPLGSMYIFPSVDPYTPKERADLRAVNENVSWINRSVKIMVACVCGWGFTITAEPRDLHEQLNDESLDAWKKNTTFELPWAAKNSSESSWSVQDIELYLFNLAVELDLQWHYARAYRYTLEQGQCGIAMLPDYKYNDNGEIDEKGKYVIPRVLRTIRPEHTTRVWLNMQTGEMDSLQVIGIRRNGGRLPAERLLWIMSEANLELNSDYYGEAKIYPLIDPAKVQAILYGKDFPEAAQYTWHQPKVFQVEIPPRDFKKAKEKLKEFLRAANNSSGRDIAVTQNVELISGQSNPGDLQGLINLDDHIIDQEAGFFNIPPFLLSKGKAGNLGGNAQQEEVDAFLNVEVRPQQEILEDYLEKQFFDRILCILFDEKDPEKLPIRIRMNMIKPDLKTLFNKEQYEIMLDMVGRKMLSEDKMIERLGLEDVKAGITERQPGDPNPSKNVWSPKWPTSMKPNPHWNNVKTNWRNDGSPPQWNGRPQINLTTPTDNVKTKTPVNQKW